MRQAISNTEDFSDWRKKTGFVLSIQRPGIFAVMEGQIRATEETNDAGTDGADTRRISPAPLFTPGFLDTTGGILQKRQTAFDRANQDLYAILYLETDKAATLLVVMHAYDERGTRGDGQKVIKELEEKYLRVTDETIRVLQSGTSRTSLSKNFRRNAETSS